MGLLDRILGRPHEPQEERAEVRRGDAAEALVGPPESVGEAGTREEQELAAEVRRDEEAVRHQGI